MKTAVITPDYPPASIGGCSTSSTLLVQTLRRAYAPVDVFVFHTARETLEEKTGRTFFFAGQPKWLLLQNLTIIKSLWSGLRDYDVIHVYNVAPVLGIVVLRLLGRLKKGVKIVMTLNNHNGAIPSRVEYTKRFFETGSGSQKWTDICKNQEVSGGALGAFIRYIEVWWIRWAGKKVDRSIALTKDMKDIYVGAGYTAEKIDVIPNMTAKQFKQQSDGQSDSAGKKDLSVLLVGQLSPLKGQKRFVEAFAELPQEIRKRCAIRILGKGKDEGRIRETVEAAGLTNVSIDFTPNEQLPTIFASADILIHLATYPEPFSRVWLEAMQHGIPVLSSGVPSAREVLGEAAEYCNPFDTESIQAAFTNLVQSGGVRDQKKQIALKRVQQYEQEAVQPQLLDWYSTHLA